MSRIGRQPIELPKNVDFKLEEGNVVTVKGPKGSLTKELHKDMIIKVEDGKVLVQRPSEDKFHRSLHGLTRTLIANMVHGVTEGYEKGLTINGVGYRAQKQGKKLILTLGYSHPLEMEEIEGITIESERKFWDSKLINLFINPPKACKYCNQGVIYLRKNNSIINPYLDKCNQYKCNREQYLRINTIFEAQNKTPASVLYNIIKFLLNDDFKGAKITKKLKEIYSLENVNPIFIYKFLQVG